MSNYYVTTSIPYINGEPHLGHAMEYIIADVLARYTRQQGTPVIYATGTDEHGGKIAEYAAKNKLTPLEYADQNSQKFKEMLQRLNISNDRFIRTTDKGHEQRSQLVWKNLAKDIYKGTYIGWYCTGCEEFVTETVAKERGNICPNHNKPYDQIKEENYFFALSKYTAKIKKAIDDGSFKIVPATRKREILSVINAGLEDISISRPKDKIDWGIPVPGDDSQVMYVWFEALLNYITVLGYPEYADFKKFWPANVQVIGKDILRFHAAIWPGILLGLGIPLPKALYVHGFVTLNGEKMSKSTGNVVDPNEIIDQTNADVFRYYFLRHIPSYGDGDFTWDAFEKAYNNELGNELGNAVQRTVVMLEKFQDGVLGEIPSRSHDEKQYHDALEAFRFDKALDEVWELIRGVNQFIDEEKPWQIAKNDDKEHLSDVLGSMVASLLQIAKLLKPFLPDTAQAIHNIFGEGVLRKPQTVLFPRVEISGTEPTKTADTSSASVPPKE